MSSKIKNKTQNSGPSENLVLGIRCYHYTNAIYMGLVKTINRVGTGIILFHDGTCAIVSYNLNSQLNGQCIFYRKRCLISAKYLRNKLVSIAYRIDGFLLYLKYNEQSKIHGYCYLVSYLQHTVHQIRFEQGSIKSKTRIKYIQKNPVENIFTCNAYNLIMEVEHSRAMNHEITMEVIKNIKMNKIGNKIQVYYSDNEYKKFSNGLGFQFIFRSPQDGGYNFSNNKYRDDFELNIVQKGLYKDNMLQGYGLRIFKNNNLYEGYFKQNLFHGEGILKNTHIGSWVYGVFERGEMIDVLEFSNDNNEEIKYQILLQNIRRNGVIYINESIEENNFQFLDVELEKVCARVNIEEVKNQTFEDRKLEILKKITAQFTQEYKKKESYEIIENLRPMTDRGAQESKNNKQNSVNTPQRNYGHIIRSFIPQTVKVTRNHDHDSKQKIRMAQTNRESLSQIRKLNRYSLKNGQDSGLKLSRIFKKDYSHLETERSGSKDIIKLHRVEKSNKPRKSHIFTQRNEQGYEISQFSLGPAASRSPGSYSQNLKSRSIKSASLYQRRSPERVTKIFEGTIKLKKLKNQNDKIKNDSGDQESTIQKLQSIRKGSIDKKNLPKKYKKTEKIFEEHKQKESPLLGKFIYVYEGDEKKMDTPTSTRRDLEKKLIPQTPPTLLKNQRNLTNKNI